MDHTPFDRRRYPILTPRDGYREWAATYDRTVLDEMDLRLLDRLASVEWADAEHAVELACGTGRVGVWLRSRGVRHLEGVDFTPEMLERAQARRAYDRLFLVDIQDSGLPGSTFDLIVVVLADEHLKELIPLYREAARLATAGSTFVLVGYHPYFLMNGVPTHFDRPDGRSVTIESHVHLFSDHVRAARGTGWALTEMEEGLVDEAWLAKKPQWERYCFHPVSFALAWRRQPPGRLAARACAPA